MDLQLADYIIEIDGTQVDGNPLWRFNRIHMVVGYAQTLADLDNNEDYYKKIKSIYDYKGHLMVTWKTKPTNNEKEYLQKAWGSIVSGYEGNEIEHEIV